MRTPFDFGPIPLGECAGPQGFNVANTGDIPLTVKAIGGLSPPFSIARWRYPEALAIGESFIVGVRFAPTAVGPYADVLTVAFNELDATLQVPLQGEGVAHSAEPVPLPTAPQTYPTPARRPSQPWLPWVVGGLIGAIYLHNKVRRG